ncbi:serine/threonine protein kinase [Sphingomonas sp. IC-11]|uniref:serine/threonine protein kinase n=1 Tax=Sphingomonas sp. IC-11 TaxID=2898528 RepID=UPI001E46A347|nr:protein kinase [Sphingomonas sp. IC-11]
MPIGFKILPDKISRVVESLSQKIEFERVIEKGGNGYVVIGTNRQLNRRIVVKFYYWGDGVHAEPRILAELASPNILDIHDAAPIDDDDAYFITPFCESGDLDDVLATGSVGVRRAVDMLLQVASGVSYIHGKGFVHRDLKPSNVFQQDPDRLVIGDFGSVVKKGAGGFAETRSRHSLLYRTPEEIVANRAYEQSDIYQLGILLYQILGGALPYDLMDWLNGQERACYSKLPHPDNEIYASKCFEERLILKGKLLAYDSLPEWCPDDLKKVIRVCCNISYEKRYESASALIGVLNNMRASLPDWRCEPTAVLHRRNAKFRIVGGPGKYTIEKMVNHGVGWRKVHAVKPTTLREAVKEAEKL